jgi:hypothetical protein
MKRWWLGRLLDLDERGETGRKLFRNVTMRADSVAQRVLLLFGNKIDIYRCDDDDDDVMWEMRL